jgi:DDE superfamily endonuclease/Helix-turn-helix of DDE superfamily endonuclease
VPSYRAGMTVSNRSLQMLADALRRRRRELGTTSRRLDPGRQALLVVAHLRKGETYRDLAVGFAVGTTTVYRYLREGLDVLAALAPTLDQAITVAAGKALVTLDGTLLRIDRVGMAAGYDRAFYSGKHQCHGVNVQVLADPAGRLIWASPAVPGARHDIAAVREHGILDALAAAGISTVADTGYQGAGPTVAVPQRRRRLDPDTRRYRALSHNQKAVNTAHARQRGPASAPTPSSRAGRSSARSAAAPAGPPPSSKPFRP